MTTNSISPSASAAHNCATTILDSVPPVTWFIRRHMRSQRKGLSLSQFRTLAHVDRQPSASLSALAEHLGSSLPTTSRIVAGLVAKGFLKRADSRKDRRELSLRITPRGRAVLDQAWSSTRTQMEFEVARLTAQQRSALVDAMAIFRSLFGSLGLPERIGNGHRPSPRPAKTRPALDRTPHTFPGA